MNVKGSAIKELDQTSCVFEQANLAILGRSLKEMRDWQICVSVLAFPESLRTPPGSEPKPKLGELYVRRLAELASEAIAEGDSALFKQIAEFLAEIRTRDPRSKPLERKQEKALWSLLGKPTSKATLFNYARKRALEVLRRVNVSVHPVYAGVLFFSRRFKSEFMEKDAAIPSEVMEREFELAMAYCDGGFLKHREMSNSLGFKCVIPACQLFLESTELDTALTASALREQLEGLLARTVSVRDVTLAAKALKIKLRKGKPGPKRN
jgi:hypothetical protein